MIRISRIIRKGIVKLRQRSVSKELMCDILNGVCLLSDSYKFFIALQITWYLQRLREFHGQFVIFKGSLSFISIFYQNGSDYIFNLYKLQGFRGKIIVDKTHLLVVEPS